MDKTLSPLAQEIADYVETRWPVALECICSFLRIDNPDLSDKQIADALYELTQKRVVHTQVNAKKHTESLVVPKRFDYLY
jgi:hypothetical protein